MAIKHLFFIALGTILSLAHALSFAHSTHADPMTLERVFILARHGVRAPLSHEAAAADYADQPWPTWKVAPSMLTPHGRENITRSGVYLRDWLFVQHHLMAPICPTPKQIRIYANTDQRTIDSADLLARAIFPHCTIHVAHQSPGTNDPLFRPVESGAIAFNAHDAVRAIQNATGGTSHLVTAHAQLFQTLAQVLDCRKKPCNFADMPSSLQPAADGRSIMLDGPINLATGTAEVILLEYADGMPMSSVGWGRVTAQRLEQLSGLHALLFEVYARPPYMASRSAGVLASQLVKVLDPRRHDVPVLSLYVGSDTQISALSSVLGAHFHVPGYGLDDPSPGAMLMVQLWKNQHTSQYFVRLAYIAQSLHQLRTVAPLSRAHPPLWQYLHSNLCAPLAHSDGFTYPAHTFASHLTKRIPPLAAPVMPATTNANANALRQH